MNLLKILFITPITFLLNASPTSDFKKGFWYDYNGSLGEKAIQISISRDEETNFLKGTYCDHSFDTKMDISGYWESDAVWLSFYREAKIYAYFKGMIDENKNIQGEFVRAGENMTQNVELKLGQIVSKGPNGRRYPDLDETDADVEHFMEEVKKAALAKDKDWLADRISYPINTRLNGTERITIENKEAFKTVFDQVFYNAFTTQLQEYPVCYLFNNYQGVMLGRGEIWIRNNPTAIDDRTDSSSPYQIVAINNGL